MHRHGGLSASKARQVLDLIRGEDVGAGRRDLDRHRARGGRGRRQGPHLGGGQRGAQRPAEPRGALRRGLLRRRGHHHKALASPGPWPGHPDPQADLPHHHHREPAPADRLELRRRRMEALSANRSRRVDASRRRADLSGRLSRRRAAQAAAEPRRPRRRPRPKTRPTRCATRPSPTRRPRRNEVETRRKTVDEATGRRRRGRRGRRVRGRRGREGQGRVNGPEGKPLRLPPRDHHRLEVPLVRGAPLP